MKGEDKGRMGALRRAVVMEGGRLGERWEGLEVVSLQAGERRRKVVVLGSG